MNAEKLRSQLKGFKINYLSKEIGVHYNTIQRFMKGSGLRLSTAEKIKKWLEDRQ